MIQFTKPTNLNGAELLQELNDAGITVNGKPFLDGNNKFWLDISEADKTKAEPIVTAHNGTVTPPDNTAAKAALLSKLGITADEAQLLLGGN
jgi:hypothetical protein